MADVVTTAFTVIFISILLLVGVVVFGTVSIPMGDQLQSREIVIAAGCSDDNDTTTTTLCTGTVSYPPIENNTRSVTVYNCTGTACVILTDGTHYNYSEVSGLFTIITDTLADIVNGSIEVEYWKNTASISADNAQQSITGTVYGGFDLATVMVIVMAAVAIVGTIFLIGRRGA